MTLEPEHIPVEQGSVEQGPIERAVFRKRHRLSGSQSSRRSLVQGSKNPEAH